MFKEFHNPTFEINLVIKDTEGNPTKRRKSYSSDDPFKIWQFYNRFQGKPKRKKKKKTKPTSAREAEKIIKEMYNDE